MGKIVTPRMSINDHAWTSEMDKESVLADGKSSSLNQQTIYGERPCYVHVECFRMYHS